MVSHCCLLNTVLIMLWTHISECKGPNIQIWNISSLKLMKLNATKQFIAFISLACLGQWFFMLNPIDMHLQCSLCCFPVWSFLKKIPHQKQMGWSRYWGGLWLFIDMQIWNIDVRLTLWSFACVLNIPITGFSFCGRYMYFKISVVEITKLSCVWTYDFVHHP